VEKSTTTMINSYGFVDISKSPKLNDFAKEIYLDKTCPQYEDKLKLFKDVMTNKG
jgi:hypothetical protein